MISPPDVDMSAGMECYATNSAPCNARVRSVDEDFCVEEVLRNVGVSAEPFPGSFPLYRVEKRSIDTFHLERSLSSILRSRVSYAGIKDKRALAIQFVSPTSSRSDVPRIIERPEYSCELVGYMRRPLSRSMIAGNRFRIVLRDCCPTIEESVTESLKACEDRKMPNYYGLQRFGARDVRTHRIGKALVLGEFERAVMILACEQRSTDDDEVRRARELISRGLFDEGQRLLPAGQDIERIVVRSLARKPGDFLGAIRAVPIALRRLYVQAYQSYIFNRTLSTVIRDGLDISRAEKGDNWGEVSVNGLSLKKIHGAREPFTGAPVPLIQLIGYAYRNYGSRFDLCSEEVMQAEGVAAKDFYIKQMQEVSLEGGFRRAHMSIKGASLKLSPGTASLQFTLARGEYATVLLREVIKPSDPEAAGFD